jgi:hypothetical protein
MDLRENLIRFQKIREKIFVKIIRDAIQIFGIGNKKIQRNYIGMSEIFV